MIFYQLNIKKFKWCKYERKIFKKLSLGGWNRQEGRINKSILYYYFFLVARFFLVEFLSLSRIKL